MTTVSPKSFSMRSLPPIFPLAIPPIAFRDPGPPLSSFVRFESPKNLQNSAPSSSIPFSEIAALTHRLQFPDQLSPALTLLSVEISKLPSHETHLPLSIFSDLALAIQVILSDLDNESLWLLIRITRGIADFFQRIIFPVFKLPPIQIPMHKSSSGRSPAIARPTARIVSTSFRVNRASATHKINGLDSPDHTILNLFELLFSKTLFLLSCHPTPPSDLASPHISRLVTSLHHPSFPPQARLFGISALLQFSAHSHFRSLLFQNDDFCQLFHLLRTPGDTDPTTSPMLCHLVALFRRLTDDPAFPRFFAVDEVAAGLVQAMRVAATYQTVVLNVFSYLLIFAEEQTVVQRTFAEFGDELLVALSLQMLSMSRTCSDAVMAICGWLGGLVDRHEQLAAVAATIVDPLDITVCAEFLSPKTEKEVLRAVLHLIAALAGNRSCALILAGRKEVSSLFAKGSVIGDIEICKGLLNVVERFTFHDSGYAPEKLVRAIPGLLRSSERAICKSVLYVVCRIATPEHAFLLREGIPGLVTDFLRDTDQMMNWLAIRVMTQLIAVFHIEAVFVTELNGKEKILELVGKQNLCRAVVIALAALVRMCQGFTDEERARIGAAVYRFESGGIQKAGAEVIDTFV